MTTQMLDPAEMDDDLAAVEWDVNPFHQPSKNGHKPAGSEPCACGAQRPHECLHKQGAIIAPEPGCIAQIRARTVDGWTFVTTASMTVPAIWGEHERILHAKGEPTMIVGPDGAGKTSLGQQYALKRVLGGKLLGLPIEKTDGRLLYIAADRPNQAARSMRRMVTTDDEEILRERMVVHRGPPPFDIVKDPIWTFAHWVEELGCTDVVIDSLKDLANKLTDDEVGGAINRAFQEATAGGTEILALHHQRKQQQGGTPPKALADVYGSRWLTAGMGSVLLLWGQPGDLVVTFNHLKQPLDEVGPFNVIHDHDQGTSSLYHHVELDTLIETTRRGGLTVKDAARHLYGNEEPASNDIEKARRRLEALIGRGTIERRDDADGTARYFSLDNT